MVTPTSPDAAYGAAHAELLAILRSHGAPDPHPLASELLNALVKAGWQWRRREVPPPRGPAVPPPPSYAEARARLHTELVALRAAEEADREA